jgi:hypothetical protein
MSEVPQAPSAGDPAPERTARLEQLRAEVAELEADLGQSPTSPARTGGWWRAPIVVACIVLLAVVAPATVVATWAHDQVADTDRYVATVAPLADNPDIQAAISKRLTTEIVTRIDVSNIVTEAADALEQQGLPSNVAASLRALGTPLEQGVEGFVADRVNDLVASEEFAQAWETANREAHDQMVALLTGETGTAVQVEGNAVTLNLAVLIDSVKARLVDSGFTLAERIPEVTAEFVLFESADIARAQNGFRLLDAVARALPVLAVILLATALVVARRRRRTLIIASLVIAGSMLVLGLVLNGFRIVYLDAISARQLSPGAAGAVYDQLVGFIRLNLRAIIVLALAVVAAAWVTGPAPGAVRVRQGTTKALDAIRHRRDRVGLNTGPVGEFLGRYRTPIRALVAGVVVLVYVLADHPTGAWTLVLLAIGALVLLVVELLARPPEEPVAVPADTS